MNPVAPRPVAPKCPSCARDMERRRFDPQAGAQGQTCKPYVAPWIGWACVRCPNVSIVEGSK